MGGKTGTTTSKVTIPKEILARYNAVNARAENVASTPFQQYSTDPNAFVAPLTGTQQAGIANTNAAVGIAQPYFGAATEAYGQGLGAALPFTVAGGEAVNPSDLNASSINKYLSPYLGTVLGATMAAQNQQNAQQRSAMQGDAIQAGAFGGDRAGIGLANLAYQQNLANAQTIANIANQGYGQALSTAQQQQGLGLSAEQANRAALQQTGQSLAGLFSNYGQGLAGLGAGAQSAALQGAQAQMAAGQAEQQTQQAGLSALYNQFLQEKSYPFQVAQFLANIAMGTGALSGSTTSTTQPMPFFSDERLKEGVEPIGETYDGQKIVRFRYRGQPERQIGLIAQDVEQRHPEAVGLAGGFKTVDYDAATDEAAERGRYHGGLAHPNVVDLAEYRAGKLGGGLVGSEDAQRILQAQQRMYEALPWAVGGLYTGHPSAQPRGGSGIVPAANLPVSGLTIAKPTSNTPQTGMQQVMGLARGMEDMEKIADLGERAYNWAMGKKPGTSRPADTGGWNADETPPGLASGGLVGDDDDVSPEGIYGPSAGLNIPQKLRQQKLASPTAPSSSPGGGLGSNLSNVAGLIGAGKTIGSGVEWLLPILGLAGGGTVPRAGMADGGDLAEAERTFRYFTDQGFSPERAAAITAQVKHESNFNPTVSHDNGIGYGLLGWNGPRLASMRERYGQSPTADQQLEFLRDEIRQGGDKGMAAWGARPDADAGSLAADLSSMGVRPRDVEGNRAARAATALQYMNLWGGGQHPTGVVPPANDTANISILDNISPDNVGAYRDLVRQRISEQQNPGWFTRNKEWVVPVLSGLGAMASSPSRYLGAAILQGLGAGAKTAGEMDYKTQLQNQQITEQAGRSAQMGEILPVLQSNAAWNAYRSVPGIGPMVMTKQFGPMPYGEWMRRGKPETVNAPPRGTPPQSTGLTPPVTPASAAPNAATIDQPTRAATPQEYSFAVTPHPKATEIAQSEAANMAGPNFDDRVKENQALFMKANEAANNSVQARPRMNDLSAALLSDRSILPTGAGIDWRQKGVAWLDLVGRQIGLPENFFSSRAPELGSDLTDQQVANKYITQLMQLGAQQGDQRSFQALQTIVAGIPNGSMTPEAIRKVLAQMYVSDQRAADFAAFFRQYQSASPGMPVGRDAEFAFNQVFTPQRYRREEENLVRMMTPPSKDQDAPLHYILNRGRDSSVQVSPERIEKIFGPGMLRYFYPNMDVR